MFQKRATIVYFLSVNVSPELFANKLRSVGLIGDDTWRRAIMPFSSTPKKIGPLIDAIISRIQLNEKNYDKFISVLEEFGSLEDLIQYITD